MALLHPGKDVRAARGECSVRDRSRPPQRTRGAGESCVDPRGGQSHRTPNCTCKRRVHSPKGPKRQNPNTAKQPTAPQVQAGLENPEYQIPCHPDTFARFSTSATARVTRRAPIHPGETDRANQVVQTYTSRSSHRAGPTRAPPGQLPDTRTLLPFSRRGGRPPPARPSSSWLPPTAK